LIIHYSFTSLIVFYNHVSYYPAWLSSLYSSTISLILITLFANQLITSLLLSMVYSASDLLSFDRINYIMIDVNFGWLIRYLHMNGSSFFLAFLYLHIFRGLFYRLNSNISRFFIWISRIFILLLVFAITFLGYILPFRQMSYWRATVILNIVSVAVSSLLGGLIISPVLFAYVMLSPDLLLSRLFLLHFLLSLLLVLLITVHILLLHLASSLSWTRIKISSFKSWGFTHSFNITLLKDLFIAIIALLIFSLFVFFFLNFFHRHDNSIKANPLVTPIHIVPEWYFLIYYSILRAFPSKIISVLMAALVLYLILAHFSLYSIKFFLFIWLAGLLNLFGAFNVEEYFLSLNRYLIIFLFILLF
jgi:ubiquinol-cytochrome c reductase cytochrome b subunit